MATATTSYAAPTAATSRSSMLRRTIAGAAAFDAAGGLFCIVAADAVSRWLSIPRGAAYTTGALFLVAAAAGTVTLRRQPLRVAWIVGANELFAVWCLLMLAVDSPNAVGTALLVLAVLSSAGTGVAELLLARRRSTGV